MKFLITSITCAAIIVVSIEMIKFVDRLKNEAYLCGQTNGMSRVAKLSNLQIDFDFTNPECIFNE